MRLFLAVLVAPAATPLVFAITAIILEPGANGARVAAALALFAAAFAYVTEAVIGLPLYALLRKRGISLGGAAGVGAAIGILVWVAYLLTVRPTPDRAGAAAFVLASATSGALSAGIFRQIVLGGAD